MDLWAEVGDPGDTCHRLIMRRPPPAPTRFLFLNVLDSSYVLTWWLGSCVVGRCSAARRHGRACVSSSLAGDLPGIRFGNAWAVPRADVVARRHQTNRRGRPLSARRAWEDILSGQVDLAAVGRYRERGWVRRFQGRRRRRRAPPRRSEVPAKRRGGGGRPWPVALRRRCWRGPLPPGERRVVARGRRIHRGSARARRAAHRQRRGLAAGRCPNTARSTGLGAGRGGGARPDGIGGSAALACGRGARGGCRWSTEPWLRLPPLVGQQAESWAALIDLAPGLGRNWLPVGGQMVFVLEVQRRAREVRPTDDIDVVVDLRVEPNGLSAIHRFLDDADFRQDLPSADGIAHRYRRGGAVVDVLAPDTIGGRARLALGSGRTLSAPGTTQAFTRSHWVDVELADGWQLPRSNGCSTTADRWRADRRR